MGKFLSDSLGGKKIRNLGGKILRERIGSGGRNVGMDQKDLDVELAEERRMDRLAEEWMENLILFCKFPKIYLY